jgi:hypothetical protein
MRIALGRLGDQAHAACGQHTFQVIAIPWHGREATLQDRIIRIGAGRETVSDAA